MIYYPKIMLLEKRQNLKEINDKSLDKYERLCTYDGPKYFSTQSMALTK